MLDVQVGFIFILILIHFYLYFILYFSFFFLGTDCLPPDTSVSGRKFISHGEWLERARDKCSHSFEATCVHCAPPVLPRYALIPGCKKHRPWPDGICLECAPVTVDLSRQEYRHVDKILVNCIPSLQNFIGLISSNERAGVQRGGILYGRYAPDPAYRHGIQAIVEAIYEPPQRHVGGSVSFLPDPNAKLVSAIATACGLIPIGSIFSRLATSKTASTSLSPAELYDSATFQLQHSPRNTDTFPGSQWVTLVVYKNPTDNQYHLQGAMASDQLTAMVRDGVLKVPKPTDTMFYKNESKPSPAHPIPDIVQKSMARGASRVSEFDPDMCLITLEATGAIAGSATALAFPPLFRHDASFPVENRQAFGIRQSPEALGRFWKENPREPSQSRISNFHALVYLASMLDSESAVSATNSVVSNTPLEEGVELLLKSVANEE
jgi:nuclear protein localization protein 4 homolog